MSDDGETVGSDTLDRRAFVKGALGGALATGLVAGCGKTKGEAPAVHTQPRLRWRLASSFPSSLDTIFGSSQVLAERISALTDGRFQIQVYQGGELVPGLQVLDAVQQGTVQIGQTASYYYTGHNPALAFDTCVPFGLTARQQNAWLFEMGGLDLLRPLFSDFNIVNFPAGNTGVQMGGWFKREIQTVDDLRGLKMRIPGLGGEVMTRLGVTVQVLAGGEIYPALERGAIDATEWVGPYDDEKLGFNKVATYYYSPGWWEPGPSLSFYFHKPSWEGLPQDYREMLQAAAQEASMSMQARYDAKNPPAFARLVEGGVKLRVFSRDILEAAREASQQMLAELAAGDATYRKIYEPWLKARKQLYDWFASAELAYQSFAFPRP